MLTENSFCFKDVSGVGLPFPLAMDEDSDVFMEVKMHCRKYYIVTQPKFCEI